MHTSDQTQLKLYLAWHRLVPEVKDLQDVVIQYLKGQNVTLFNTMVAVEVLQQQQQQQTNSSTVFCLKFNPS